jgi:hypothetical protein
VARKRVLDRQDPIQLAWMVNEVSAGALRPTPGVRSTADESDVRTRLCRSQAETWFTDPHKADGVLADRTRTGYP